MNVFSFMGLMRSIYGKKLPDLEKIQDKGLLAVKIAQHFALRVDFLDASVCKHLANLFTMARPAQGVDGRELMKSYVTDEWFSNFSEIEKKPFAVASIGQVHKATLQSGQQVIIKVIKSDFKDSFLKDLRSLRRLLKFVLFFYPKLRKVFDPLAILDHIEEYTLSELDLQHEIEGRNVLTKIKEDYHSKHDLSKLKLPHFYKDLSSKNILVADFIEGTTFDKALEQKSLKYENLLSLFNLHGLFIFAAGTFHGDLHPGNVILDKQENIHFIDTGALSNSTRLMSRGLFDFFCNLAEYDYDGCAESLHKMAIKRIPDHKYEIFVRKFKKLYEDFKGKSVSEVSLTKKMMDTIKLAVHSGMVFDQGMFPIIKSLMYLDGMVLRCKPEARLIEDMKPVVEEFRVKIFED